MSDKILKFTVPEHIETIKARNFLRNYCNVSARMIARLKREKDGILRDGKILRTIDTLKGGDVVELRLPGDINTVTAVEGDLNILFEDDYIIIFDKPAGTPVHPTKVHQLNTLANFLSYRQQKTGENYTFRAINRLDKDTSGIVVVAKDKYTAKALFDNISKIYYAVCEGVIDSAGTIDKPIRLLEGHTIQRTTADDGARSITHYKPLKTVNNHTLLEITLETGHTHQIRCHFSSIGYSLAGDDMYGGSLDFITRQALHCGSVTFVHPITNEEITVVSELPDDIKSVIEE